MLNLPPEQTTHNRRCFVDLVPIVRVIVLQFKANAEDKARLISKISASKYDTEKTFVLFYAVSLNSISAKRSCNSWIHLKTA